MRQKHRETLLHARGKPRKSQPRKSQPSMLFAHASLRFAARSRHDGGRTGLGRRHALACAGSGAQTAGTTKLQEALGSGVAVGGQVAVQDSTQVRLNKLGALSGQSIGTPKARGRRPKQQRLGHSHHAHQGGCQPLSARTYYARASVVAGAC